MAPTKRGRPPKDKKALLIPETLRLTKSMTEEIDQISAVLANEGLDRADTKRRLLALGIKAWKKENPQ